MTPLNSAYAHPKRYPSLDSLRKTLASRSEPMIVLDESRRIVFANRQFLRAFGKSDESVIGLSCFSVSHQSDSPCESFGETCPLKSAMASGHRERVVHIHHSALGAQHVAIDLTPVQIDEQPGERYYVEGLRSLNFDDERSRSSSLVGQSRAFSKVIDRISRVGPSKACVLLLGETGTGKAGFAHAVHRESPRSEEPFVVVDCAGLPEPLFESELLGLERGPLLGVSPKPGLVEMADHGTLFLDEVGDLSLVSQAKLLRLVEDGTYRRVGGGETLKSDIRWVCATRHDLRKRVEQGLFREDLYFRISVFPIVIPPLRERLDDLPILAKHFLHQISKETGYIRDSLSLSPHALWALDKYAFPGNVRELQNLLERATLLCDGAEIQVQHIKEALAADRLHMMEGKKDEEDGVAEPRSLKDEERRLFKLAISAGSKPRSALAKELGISTRTLYRRLQAIER